MIQKLAMIRHPGLLMFITLTYRDQEWFGDNLNCRDLKDQLDLFCKWLEYNYPGCGVIWRVEAKRRLSGVHTGKVAPHIHLVVRGVTENLGKFQQAARLQWAVLTDSLKRGAYPRCEVEIAKSRRHALYYLSKYTAKVETGPDENYISEFFHNRENDFGRHWGIRGHWDMSTSFTFELSVSEAVILKRLIRAWLRSRKQSHYARKLARVKPEHGMFVCGLGDNDELGRSPPILRMVRCARQLAKI